MKIVIIIPAYNEEATISEVVKEALKHGDTIVVDDGSSDNTGILAKKAGAKVIKHEKNKGKGAALKTGVRSIINSGYDVIIFMDGDGQHDPKYIKPLASRINSAQIVIGSRFLGDISKMPLKRRFSNRITTYILKHLTGYHLTDSQSGFKAINANCAQMLLKIPYDDYIYESELICAAAAHNLIVDEIPITCNYDLEKSYIGIADLLKYMIFIARLLSLKIIEKIAGFLSTLRG
ncbi:MAG TPA: glycosyltransferase family 2 protein [Methanothermobacter sp.]|nr:dolichyl-phosphate mannose synthase related protein [Methanothermobacter sp. MT-2]HOK72624.1 glycosyltransferase family 2 protein [Methanothermobacter sp.]HOL68656.1 glycosyltransferase family 2 protein [Methanothermobacter sp.]HPQ04415.1 glycosyltransferase family 2 protein [Methanothermobacter sp.]HPU36606.1 glycosyltransferase family 2 protein [Methanothermobacter sp.]